MTAPLSWPGPKPPSERAPDSHFLRCRQLWAQVVIHAYLDWWRRAERAHGDAAALARIHADALSYFSRRDGREVVALAGIEATPETLADAAVDLDAKRQMLAAHGVAQ